MKNTTTFSHYNLFERQTKKEWKSKLKDKSPLSKYGHANYDPIYFKEEILNTNTFEKSPTWDIVAEINIVDEKSANKEALRILKMGANSISFLNFQQHNLELILKDIQIDIVNINFKKHENSELIIKQLQKIAKKRNIDVNQLKGVFYNEYISDEQYQEYIRILPNYRFLATSITRFRENQKTHYTNIEIKHILFTYETSNLFLLEIAKLRALRIDFEREFQKNPYIECVISISDT